MGDENAEQSNKKRRSNWITAYSEMTIEETEKRLGLRIDELKAVSVDRMLANAKHSPKKVEVDAMKEKVYDRIVEHLESEGYPTEANTDFKEDLVYSIIIPIITDFRRKTGRNVRLTREKEIISTDNETGGMEEFVVMDRISVTEKKFVLVMEGKKSSTREAMKQCLLAMKDARDNNGEGVLYGFVTTGEHWEMIRYDGTMFQKTTKFAVVFDPMGEEKETWIEKYSVVVDCMYAALSDGGIEKDMVEKDVVVGK